MQETDGIQKLTLENRRKLVMDGVDSVDAFSERELRLTLNGTKVLIGGEGLKITAYNKGTGSFCADGKICSIRYDEKKGPLLKRIFK